MVTDPKRGKNDPVVWDESDKKLLEANKKLCGENTEDAVFFDPNVSDYEVFMIRLHNSVDSIAQEIRDKMTKSSTEAKDSE
jgi:hypothetical protein